MQPEDGPFKVVPAIVESTKVRPEDPLGSVHDRQLRADALGSLPRHPHARPPALLRQPGSVSPADT